MKTIPVRDITSTKTENAGRFSIRKLEDILQGKELRHDPHRHNFHFILAVEHGSGMHEIDFLKHTADSKSIFLLRPGQVHQLHLAAGTSGYLIEFDNAFYHPNDIASLQRMQKVSSVNVYRLSATSYQPINELLRSMFDEFCAREANFLDVLRLNLDLFYITLLRHNSTNQGGAKASTVYMQDRFEQFMALLEQHIYTHKQVSQYTNMLALSAYQLNEITKASVGKTASELINEQILLEAKRYLLATPSLVKEIADQLGYEDTSYFIRFFKKHTGYSPEAFRTNS